MAFTNYLTALMPFPTFMMTKGRYNYSIGAGFGKGTLFDLYFYFLY